MSHDRGLRLQNALARYLAKPEWWPDAESAGSGRPGTDVLKVADVAWENKTAKDFRPLAFVRQAKKHALAMAARSEPFGRPIVPVVVYWPEGVGEASVDATLSILPTGVLVRLLKEAGY